MKFKDKTQITTMMDKRYNVSFTNSELLWFLKYTHNWYDNDNVIPISIIKMFINTIFSAIMFEEENFHHIFVKYESHDGIVQCILRGQLHNFVLATMYAQYFFAQHKINNNALNPSKWKESEYNK